MNLVDIAIAVVMLVFFFEGLRRGFLVGLIELVGIIFSVSIPLLFYIPGSRILGDLGVSGVYSGALAFLIMFFIVISVYSAISRRIYGWIPPIIRTSRVNKVFGIFTGLLKGVVIATVLLAVFASLPVPYITSERMEKSELGAPLLDAAATASSITAHIFGEPLRHAVGFFTIEIDTGEAVDLDFSVDDPVIDQEAEREMLRLVNEERAQRGLPELVMDETLRQVARKHSVDMYQKGYFSHIDLEGGTPFERMEAGGVSFVVAGENLAVAPTTSIAHKGLMDSPGHKENIIRPEFRRVGIGAARDDRYGIIFTQNFTN